MDALKLSDTLADPIQTLGMSYYFDPLTNETGKALGLNVFEFYGLGRGGVLGDVDFDTVCNAFVFFAPSTMDFLWTKAKTKADPVVIAPKHLDAAYAFADRTFGAVDATLLKNFGAYARRVGEGQTPGISPLLDGYLKFPAPGDPVHSAYLGTILLRELRGGVHIHAVKEVGLSGLEACYLQDDSIFKLHGYTDDEVPTDLTGLKEKKIAAEEKTSDMMAAAFAVLTDDERDEVATATADMFAALGAPVAVSH